MRPIALTVLICSLNSIAAADDVFTQKPVIAPSVVNGEPPPSPETPTPADVDADWAKRFADGPAPLWIWGQDQDTRYFLKKTIAGPAKEARVKFTADNHVRLFLNGKQVGSCDEW